MRVSGWAEEHDIVVLAPLPLTRECLLVGTKPTYGNVRYLVAVGWKADIEQAASVIVLLRGKALR